MADLYAKLTRSPPGAVAARALGLPRPVKLERHRAGAPLIEGTVLLGGTLDGPMLAAAQRALSEASVEVSSTLQEENAVGAGSAADAGGRTDSPVKGLVFDASQIPDAGELAKLHAFLHPTVGRLQRNGRVLVLGRPPEQMGGRARVAQRALEGFTRSLAKELGARGATVQLIYVAEGAEEQLTGTMRFLLSPRSAYISGQVIRIGEGPGRPAGFDWEQPLRGKTALVTGAAQGIGASIAAVLARDGARVVGLDVQQNRVRLETALSELGGEALIMDVTQPETPQLLAKRFADGLDIVVHNAGITRDRTLAKMPAERWAQPMRINLTSPERINRMLLERDLLCPGGRIVGVSSMSGIAGNAGQSNYATSKAGVIGMVDALAEQLAEHGSTINAVAPGFIETAMTDAMPMLVREAGRRMNSLRQGGLPVDVAETVAWFASPAAGGVNGSVIRVCGQSLIGA